MRRPARTAVPVRVACLMLAASFTLPGCSLVGRKHVEPRESTRIPSGSNVPQAPPDVLAIPDAVPTQALPSRSVPSGCSSKSIVIVPVIA